MKRTVTYNRAVQQLAKIGKAVNEFYFNNELPPVTITIQSNSRAHGWCTLSPVWTNADGEHTFEINVSAETCSREILSVCATLIHEFSHLYDIVHGIKDCASNGRHNRKFKKTAEEIGHLIIDCHPVYGWTITSPSSDQDYDDGKDTLSFVMAYGFQDIMISRDFDFGVMTGSGAPSAGNGNGKAIKPKRPSNSKRYQCPICKAIVRATSYVNVICGDCGVPFELTNG